MKLKAASCSLFSFNILLFHGIQVEFRHLHTEAATVSRNLHGVIEADGSYSEHVVY